MTGNGTALHPYVISTCGHFQQIDNHLASHYILNNDIDCSGSNLEVASGGAFTGDFNGNNHTITFDNNQDSTDNVGLFGTITGASIYNLQLISVNGVSGNRSVGALAGVADFATITNVTSSVDVLGHNAIGGLIGQSSYTSIYSSSSSGNISGDKFVGGIVGYASNMDLENITNTANINGFNGGGLVGGIIGYLEATGLENIFTNVKESGNVSNDGDDTGGIIGSVNLYDGGILTISDTHYNGDISVSSSRSISGGIIGYLNDYSSVSNTSFSISNSDTKGTITGNSDGGSFGGLIGDIDQYINSDNLQNNISILNNSSSMDVSSASDAVGGLIGYIYQDTNGKSGNLLTLTMTGNHTTGNITSNGGYVVGGLVGYDETYNNKFSTLDYSVNQNYATGTILGLGATGGIFGALDAFGPSNINFSEDYFSGPSVIASADVDAGGLFGSLSSDSNNITVSDSYANTNVIALANIGGLVGSAYNVDINRSYATGSVNGTDPNLSSKAGGLVGIIDGSNFSNINNSWSASSIDPFNLNNTFGAVVGSQGNVAFSNVYYDQTKSFISDCVGSGSVTIDCHAENIGNSDNSYFKNNTTNEPYLSGAWDFNNIWDNNKIGQYPRLHNISADDATDLFAVGNGTDVKPYQITTCQQWENINHDLTASYVLENNLSCAGEENNIIIGGQIDLNLPSSMFLGKVDGNNKSIDININYSGGGEHITGLFTITGLATISNLNVTGSVISNAKSYTGGIIGIDYAQSRISHSSFTGTVSGQDDVGGLLVILQILVVLELNIHIFQEMLLVIMVSEVWLEGWSAHIFENLILVAM